MFLVSSDKHDIEGPYHGFLVIMPHFKILRHKECQRTEKQTLSSWNLLMSRIHYDIS